MSKYILVKKTNDMYLMHHGVDGMRWGKRNGPPYPLERKADKGEKVVRTENGGIKVISKGENTKTKINKYRNSEIKRVRSKISKYESKAKNASDKDLYIPSVEPGNMGYGSKKSMYESKLDRAKNELEILSNMSDDEVKAEYKDRGRRVIEEIFSFGTANSTQRYREDLSNTEQFKNRVKAEKEKAIAESNKAEKEKRWNDYWKLGINNNKSVDIQKEIQNKSIDFYNGEAKNERQQKLLNDLDKIDNKYRNDNNKMGLNSEYRKERNKIYDKIMSNVLKDINIPDTKDNREKYSYLVFYD